MSNIRLSFAVDADSVSLKSILKKDFLELQMRAISSANPNLNGSWFTKEALLDAVDSCKNKPILGYFNADGDFESHNGVWRKDVETGLDYWDTKDGEQVLGLIRDTDDIKVVDGEDGLSWLCLSCALWTQYNFKQVKRLIKDAKKAKETGGVTKNISVEIDILEGEKQDNGVYRIDKFKLAGITILGSRKGKQVLPGIAGAALSIPEIIGSDFYAKQESAIRAAYARLDDNTTDDGNNKGDVLEMNDKLNNVQPITDIQPNPENPEENALITQSEDGEVCPECGKNPCECEKDSKQECGQCADKCEEGDEDDEDEGDDHEGDKGGEGKPEDEYDAGEPNPDEIKDIAWLVNNLTYGFSEIDCSIHYYEFLMENYPEKAPHGDYIISVLKRMRNYYTKIEGTVGGLLAKIAGEITEADEQYEAKLVKYENVEELIENYEKEISDNATLTETNGNLKASVDTYEKENSELKGRLDKYAHEEFMAQVDALMKSVQLDEKVSKAIYEACNNGSLHTYDEVKTKVALAVFEAQQSTENIPQNKSLQSPVITPDTQAAFEAKAETSQRRDSWTIMREHYIKK